MKNTILKQAVATAVFAFSATAANAQSLTFNFDYIAQAQSSSTLSPGASITSLSATATPVGSITFTDLSDLNLGDGKTGVRISANINFSQLSSGTGSIYSDTVEFSFPGTGAGTGGVEYLNGDTLTGGTNAGQAFNGFNVANLISVANQDGTHSNAYAWLRVRSTNGGIQSTGQWFDPYLNASTSAGVTTETLNFLAIAAVPETDTYAMLLAGLGVIGMIVRRRSTM